MAPVYMSVPVVPAPMIQKYARPVRSLPLEKVKAAVPAKIQNEDEFVVEQLDSSVFNVDVDGKEYTVFIPDDVEP
jgi:hypothetical protein